MVEGRDRGPCADPDLRGACCYGSANREYGGDVAVFAEVMLSDPDRIKPDFLGEHCLVEELAIELRVRSRFERRPLQRIEAETDLHESARLVEQPPAINHERVARDVTRV